MTHMLLALWTPQQVKCPEALDLVEMRLTRRTQILDGVVFLLLDNVSWSFLPKLQAL
jgi:hypothetical protein